MTTTVLLTAGFDPEPMADAGRWSELLELLETARVGAATTMGEEQRLLGSAAHEIAATLALRAPAAYATAILQPRYTDGQGAFGPLWETLSQRPWRELAPHPVEPRMRHLMAYSCGLRGEDIGSTGDLDPTLLGPSLELRPWETVGWDPDAVPWYSVRGCSRSGVGRPDGDRTEVGLPDPVALAVAEPGASRKAGHPSLPAALTVASWADVTLHRGTAHQAAAAESPEGVTHGTEVGYEMVHGTLLGLAAGSGAYERWRGMALARVAVWRMLTAMAGLEHPATPRDVTDFVARLRCVEWLEPGDDRCVFSVHLAVEDPQQGLSWVFNGQNFD